MTLLVIASIAAGVNSTVPAIVDPRDFRPQATHRAINALWFTSLTLALVVSILAILTKQWMGMFISRMRMPIRDFRRWAHRHRTYRESIDRWHINTFVSCLSVALHISLLLFLLGLIFYTYGLDLASFAAVSGLSTLAVLFYTATTLAPLFDETCPTVTPLFDYFRVVVSWRFGWPGQRKGGAEPPLAKRCAESREPDVADVQILTWMLDNLAGEHDVDVALDAVAHLAPYHTQDLVRVTSQASVLSCARLQRLVDGKQPDGTRTDAAEIARALRSSLCVEDGRNQQTLVLSNQLSTNVRTYDVGVLVGALGIHFASLASPNPLDWASTLARFNVDNFCAALGNWTRHSGRDPSCPVTTHTRRIVYNALSGAARRTPDLIGIENCAWLVLAFGREEDATEWTQLLAVFLDHAIRNSKYGGSWAPLSSQVNPELRVMHAWAWVFTRMSTAPDPETFGSLGRDDAWRCYLLHAEGWPALSGESVPSLSRLQSTLAPFTSDMDDTAAATSGAFRLLRLAMRDRNAVQRGWNHSIAQIVFNVFDRSRRHRGRHQAISGAGVFEFLATLLSSKRPHEDMVNGILTHGTPYDMIQQSTLNILVPRMTRDGGHSSIWRLAVELLNEPSYSHVLTSHAVALSTQLTVLATLDSALPTAELFEQLLGDDDGLSLLLAADRATNDAFDLAHHIAMSAPQRWKNMRMQLVASKWDRPRHSSDKTLQLSGSVESATPCIECAAVVERATKLVDQPLSERQETSFKEITMWFDEHDIEHQTLTKCQ